MIIVWKTHCLLIVIKNIRMITNDAKGSTNIKKDFVKWNVEIYEVLQNYINGSNSSFWLRLEL